MVFCVADSTGTIHKINTCPQCNNLSHPKHKLCYDCLLLKTRDETTADVIELVENNDSKSDHVECVTFDLEDKVSDRIAEHEEFIQKIYKGREFK